MEGTSAPARPAPNVIPASFNALATRLQNGGEHLGDLVWWTLWDARIARGHLENLWTQAGLPLNLLPKAPSAEKALKTAARECQVGKADLLIRLGKESETELVFALVRESRDTAGNVTHQQETRVHLARDTERLTSDDPQHPDAVAILDTFHELRHTHTPDDLRGALVKALHDFSAVTLRESGGIYWVPRTYSARLRRLKTAIEQIGKSRFYLLPLHASDDAAQALGAVAQGSLEQELATLQAEIEKFQSEPPDRASTLERRLEAFEALRAKATLYRTILNVQVVDLDQRLTAMTESVQSLLSVKQAA